MTGSKLQGKVIKELESRGYLVVNVTAATKNGVSDLICCSSKGKFLALEIKGDGDTLKPLQKHFLKECRVRGTDSKVVKSMDDLKGL